MCVCVCVLMLPWVFQCVSVSNKFVRSTSVSVCVGICLYRGDTLSVSVLCVFTWMYNWCVYYLSLTSVCVFDCPFSFAWVGETLFLFLLAYKCDFHLLANPEKKEYGNNREARTSASVDQKWSGRDLTSYNRNTHVHKLCSRGCSEGSDRRPAIHD